jgi:hypothetical protein
LANLLRLTLPKDKHQELGISAIVIDKVRYMGAYVIMKANADGAKPLCAPSQSEGELRMKKWMWIVLTVIVLIGGTAAFTIGFVNSTMIEPGKAAVVVQEYEGSVKAIEAERLTIHSGDREEVFRLTGSTDLQGEEFRSIHPGANVRIGVNEGRDIVWLRLVR